MSSLRNYILVTGAYWAFTLTDGALRMLVLLHFHELGYTPVQLAFLFLFYELFGVVTNLVGGWLAATLGLRATLLGGLTLQVVALSMLALLDPDWGRAASVAYVMSAQALSGIAKDLTKMSSKSAVKLLVTDDSQSTLFKYVAVLTGSKNALKGIGFFRVAIFFPYITSLVAVVGLFELVGIVDRIVSGQTIYRPYQREAYIVIAVIYFVISYAMSDVSRRLEQSGAGSIRRL